MSKKFAVVGLSLLSFLSVSVPAPAFAALITTQESLRAQSRETDEAAIKAWLNREQVQAELTKSGISAELAAERVAALTDAEVQRLATLIADEPAGQLLGLVGVVFVVLLVLELVGVIDIFKKI